MKQDSNDAEQRLLSSKTLDELIKLKMEEELNAELEMANHKPEMKVVFKISEVPRDLIFSRRAIYRVFNRVNKIETFVNGVQAEAMLGLQMSISTKMLEGKMDAFSTDSAYVKFEKIEI